MFYAWGINRMKRLKDFKIAEQISRPVIKALPMQFGDDEATRRMVLHHVKRVLAQHKEEIQNLANK